MPAPTPFFADPSGLVAAAAPDAFENAPPLDAEGAPAPSAGAAQEPRWALVALEIAERDRPGVKRMAAFGIDLSQSEVFQQFRALFPERPAEEALAFMLCGQSVVSRFMRAIEEAAESSPLQAGHVRWDGLTRGSGESWLGKGLSRPRKASGREGSQESPRGGVWVASGSLTDRRHASAEACSQWTLLLAQKARPEIERVFSSQSVLFAQAEETEGDALERLGRMAWAQEEALQIRSQVEAASLPAALAQEAQAGKRAARSL